MKSEEEIQSAIELYAGMIQRICILHMKQQADTEDVFQTVLLKYAQSKSLRDREYEKARLLKATTNICRERFRGWSHKHAGLQTEVEACADLNETPYFLLDTLNQLPPHYRDVPCLLYYEGYKVQEVSGIRGGNKNIIHTWLKRGREALREKLGGELDDFR